MPTIWGLPSLYSRYFIKGAIMKQESYLNIQGWMVTDLHLTGVKLLIYAIIYGFSQDGKSDFHGSISYLQEWTGSCENTVRKYLSELVKEGLIKAFSVNGGATHFTSNFEPPQNLHPTPSKFEGDNKDNKKENILSKDSRKNLYQKCVDVMDEVVTDSDVRDRLLAYLSVRLSEKSISAKSWGTLIDKLYDIADSKEMALKVIQQSIDKCYKSFYPLSTYQKKDYSGGARDTSQLAEDEITRAYHEWAEDGRFFGEKEEFKKLVEKGEIVI